MSNIRSIERTARSSRASPMRTWAGSPAPCDGVGLAVHFPQLNLLSPPADVLAEDRGRPFLGSRRVIGSSSRRVNRHNGRRSHGCRTLGEDLANCLEVEEPPAADSQTRNSARIRLLNQPAHRQPKLLMEAPEIREF